ncbi:MAG: hypothetical protein QM599_01510 [Pseudoxanthomonas sp.]
MTDDCPWVVNQEDWDAYRILDPLTIEQAACLMGEVSVSRGIPNRQYHDGNYQRAAVIRDALLQAVRTGAIRAQECMGNFWNEGITRCAQDDVELCDATTIMQADLAQWADAKGLLHEWKQQATTASQQARDLSRYPDELRAAIEAFEAVRDNVPAGKTPKAAISEWLKANKSELSESARDRIATMSNWQREGGAPKTPTGGGG